MTLILQVLALICLAMATFGFSPTPRVSFGWAGMLLWLLSLMLGGLILHTTAG